MKVLISSHIDTVFQDPFARVKNNGIFLGACDNFASVMVVGRLLDEPDLYIELTEDEERNMDGCRYVARQYDPSEMFIIVLDVEERAIAGKKTNFTVENWHGITEKHIKRALKEFNGHYKRIKEGTESEAWLYKELGFACLEVDIPVSGGLHSLDSKARIEDILKVSKAVKAIADYVRDKTREELGDIYKVGEK